MSKNKHASCVHFLADLINSSPSLQTFAVLDKFQLSKINLKDLQSLKLCWLNLQVLKGVLLPQDNRTLSALMWVYY